MVVDDRVAGLQFDGALEQADGLVVMAELVMRPAERIDDIAVLGLQFDRAAQHLERFVEMQVLVDPGIAEIIQHQRLFGVELEGFLQIGLGLVPILARS